jgi:hypothetical protein
LVELVVAAVVDSLLAAVSPLPSEMSPSDPSSPQAVARVKLMVRIARFMSMPSPW